MASMASVVKVPSPLSFELQIAIAATVTLPRCRWTRQNTNRAVAIESIDYCY